MLGSYRRELDTTEPLPFGIHGEVIEPGSGAVGDAVALEGRCRGHGVACGGMSDERVKVEVDDHVAVVTLTRADKHNALDIAMFEAIIGAAERLTSEPGVRAVVLHGDGPSFCSGLDVMSIMASGGASRHRDPLNGEVPNWFQRAAYDWIRCPCR